MNMMTGRQFGSYIFGIAAAVVMVASMHANAQAASPSASASQSALAVSPAIVEQITPPGKPKTFTIQVTNTTAFPLPISSRTQNFVPLEQIEDSADVSKYDASKWFTISDPDFILQPKETRKVTVSVTPPAGAEPGGHYATIYFTPMIPDTALSPSTAYLSAQVGTLAFLVVPGNMTEKLSVSTFTTPHVHQSQTVDFTVRLKNTGSVHVAPNATIHITDWRGKTVASLPLKSGIVLPGTEKAATASWHASAFLGKYSATLTVSYGAANTPVKPVTISFWIFPWGRLLSILLPIGLGASIYIRTRGRWKHAWHILTGKAK